MNRYKALAIALAAVVIAAPLAYYFLKTPPDPLHHVPRSRAPLQGLAGWERTRFYHLTMGSELFPLTWLRCLESKQTGQPFLQDVERFGLLPDPDDPDGLPVGMTAAPPRTAPGAGKMVGLNCAACHTGEITYKGKRLRLEGAPGLFYGEAFVEDLLGSAKATVESPEKLFEFLKRLAEDGGGPTAKRAPLLARLPVLAQLRQLGAMETALVHHLMELHRAELTRPPEAAVETVQVELKSILSGKSPEKGPLAQMTPQARESGLKEVFDHFLETTRLLRAKVEFAKKMQAEAALKLKNTRGGPGRVDDFGSARNLLFDVADARPATAPCSSPPLWGTGSFLWTDWDGSTQSTLGRSLATALAGGAAFDPRTHQSTVPLRNVAELDRLAEKITPPPWPTDLFGPIDAERAKRGAALYQDHCIKCHLDSDAQPAPELLFSPQEVGTDPLRAENFALPLGKRPYAEAIQEMINLYVQRACKDDGIDAAELRKLEGGHPNVWRTTKQYIARPLVSVWATAPYLHNGSVPTLYHLLLPAEQRPKTFPVGQREYDPEKLGYITEVQGTPRFVFDTTLPGNRNTGHEYGKQLTAEQRADLLEYLKTK
jgi:mono/diheme cytochrome c family protein